jgi:hypothetical protein
MQNLMRVFASDPTIVATANLFALITGTAFFVALFIATWRFVRNAYQTSIRSALLRIRNRHRMIAYRCATDVHAYLSRIALLFLILATSSVGLLVSGIAQLLPKTSHSGFLTPFFTTFNQIAFIWFTAFFLWGLNRLRALLRSVNRMRTRFRKRHRRARLAENYRNTRSAPAADSE